MVCPPSRGFVSLVSQLVSQLVFLLVSQLVCLLVSLCGGWSDFAFFSSSVLLGVLNAFLRCPPWCWMVCPPSEGLVSPCLPLSPFLFPFVGWCVRLPEGLVSPCLSLSPLVSLVPILVSSCLPLSPFVSPCLPVGCLLSPLVSLLVSFLVSLCWMVCPLCLPLSPFLFPKQCAVSGS